MVVFVAALLVSFASISIEAAPLHYSRPRQRHPCRRRPRRRRPRRRRGRRRRDYPIPPHPRALVRVSPASPWVPARAAVNPRTPTLPRS